MSVPPYFSMWTSLAGKGGRVEVEQNLFNRKMKTLFWKYNLLDTLFRLGIACHSIYEKDITV